MAFHTKLTPELIEKATDYLDNCPDTIPTIVGLCLIIDIARKTLYSWINHPDNSTESMAICRIHELLLCEQQHLLLNKGLLGEFNSNIAKLMLGKHGYSEKQEVVAQTTQCTVADLTDEGLAAELAKYGIKQP
jgi:hypothetical protein